MWVEQDPTIQIQRLVDLVLGNRTKGLPQEERLLARLIQGIFGDHHSKAQRPKTFLLTLTPLMAELPGTRHHGPVSGSEFVPTLGHPAVMGNVCDTQCGPRAQIHGINLKATERYGFNNTDPLQEGPHLHNELRSHGFLVDLDVYGVYHEGMITILDRLVDRFRWLEREDLRVGTIYLREEDILELEKYPSDYDKICVMDLLEAGFKGSLWGAQVKVSDVVPPGRLCIIQEGLEVKSISAEACVTF